MDAELLTECVEACNHCADLCDQCAIACLQESNPKAMARCIALDIDCAQICRLAAGFMARGSEAMNTLCALCADVCSACSHECERHADMPHCQRCADACSRCAEACRAMVNGEREVASV